jgi:hypothetical protein
VTTAELRTTPDVAGESRLDEIALEWQTRTRVLYRAHEQAARIYARRGIMLSVAILTLASVVGTAIFATVNSEPSDTWKVVTGLVSLAAAVLAAFQAFLQYPELAHHHRQAASRMGGLMRRLDVISAAGSVDASALEEVRLRWERISEEAPAVAGRLYKRAERDVRQRARGGP